MPCLSCFGAGDPPIAVVIPKRQRVDIVFLCEADALAGRVAGTARLPALHHHYIRRAALRKHRFRRFCFIAVYRQAVFAAHFERSGDEPARVEIRRPLGYVLAAFLVAVYRSDSRA